VRASRSDPVGRAATVGGAVTTGSALAVLIVVYCLWLLLWLLPRERDHDDSDDAHRKG
jgi:hypothetical protein